MGTRSEEVARHAKVQASKDWRKQWWEAKDAVPMLEALLKQLQRDDPAPSRVLVAERGITAAGNEVLWMCVEDTSTLTRTIHTDVTDREAFNFSHPCPPCCPDCPD